MWPAREGEKEEEKEEEDSLIKFSNCHLSRGEKQLKYNDGKYSKCSTASYMSTHASI